jgi:hypothetical protein
MLASEIASQVYFLYQPEFYMLAGRLLGTLPFCFKLVNSLRISDWDTDRARTRFDHIRHLFKRSQTSWLPAGTSPA